MTPWKCGSAELETLGFCAGHIMHVSIRPIRHLAVRMKGLWRAGEQGEDTSDGLLLGDLPSALLRGFLSAPRESCTRISRQCCRGDVHANQPLAKDSSRALYDEHPGIFVIVLTGHRCKSP